MRIHLAYFRILGLLMFILLTCVGVARAEVACRKIFDYDTIADKHRNLPSYTELMAQFETIDRTELQKRIQSIYSRKIFSRAEMRERAFNEFIDTRLKLLPAEIQEVARDALNNIKYKHDEEFINGSYNYEKVELTIKIPENLKGSLLDYVIRVHEVEHLIQDFLISQDATNFSRRTKAFYHKVMHKSEEGAMLAEGFFLHSLPRDIVIQELMALDSRTYFHHFLQGMELSFTPSEYVEIQWTFGRYSEKNMDEIYQNFISRKVKKVILTALGGYTFYYVSGLIHQMYFMTGP